MDVTTLLGVLNIATTLGAGLLLWWGLSAKFDHLEDYLVAHRGGLPNGADRIKGRVGQTARLDKVSTRVDGLTTRVDGLAMAAARIEGRLKMDHVDRRIPNSLRRRSRIDLHRRTKD